jgi:hypothetical protein
MVAGRAEQQGDEQRRRQRRAGTVRKIRIAIAVDEGEQASLVDAAREKGLTVSAFVADAALRAARRDSMPDTSDLMHAVAGLARAAVQVQRVGTNLNQAVAALNATGQPPGNLLPYARYATEVVRRLDEAARRVSRLVP